MSLSKEMLIAIEDELKKQVERCNIQPNMDQLRYMMAYHLGWEGQGAGPEARGKRIRPLLVTLCAAASGSDWRKGLPASAAVELIHNFSLIHDDIEDQSPLRRGRPTVWKLWGIPQAINTGDAMYALAHLAIFDLSLHLPQDTVLRCAKRLQQTCLELTQGQFLDISFEQRNDLSLESYWQMIRGKTASLLACSCELGAIIAGADPETIENYAQFGSNLGLAFQALDDILGIWGDASQTGKSIESDLATGKKTLPVLYGLNQRGVFYERWSKKPIETDEISTATQVLLSEGAKDYTQDYASRLTKEALSALERAKPLGQAGEELMQLTLSLLNRHH